MSQPNSSHDHGHDHDHSHTPTVTGANERKVLISFILIFTFMVVEAVGGVLSGSLALLADAGHMLTDAVALALAYAAFRFGRRAADSKRTFGYLRFEVIAGFVNAVTLFAIVGWIGYEAWERFFDPPQILAGPMMIVAIAGLLVNVLVLWIMTRGDTDHVNIKGAVLHVMGDLLGSVGAIVAAVVVMLTGWTPIDPILSVLVAALILRSAWKLLAKSIHILLEGAPENASPEQVEHGLMNSVPGLAAVSHVHVWQLTSGRTLATLHIRPKADEQAKAVAKLVEKELKERFSVEHATVAIDWNTDADEAACSLQAVAQGAVDHEHDHGHEDHEHGDSANGHRQ
ncbi:MULTISPECIES: cation diffusion facilitator family transporter [Gammaproteobacteria]|uniref:cation diffusion facilitator family transporter n=1 Tax=Gammaproteobacteria TaxID=1236 RepID=UPI0016594F81|nr:MULTISPECIES: cation diffusion facilitator family transporter [Gammaproteobacteria]MCD9354726.1 cation diffusion facilitator family transporter [Klebsiella pneumoniae]MCD9415400.1 cation diffusion facilitator family transporter [Klebsiella pneumoniae]MCD9608986.1 cation diffusion facilitator family transporter [Raoultella planticola]MDE9664880.1 cation diffusion facilitator family transporter [Citrobacter portucalensis]MDE9674520.1 cation diffusion facilitator family transporter [Citrobacte